MQGKASQTGEMWPHHKTQLHFKTTISPTNLPLKIRAWNKRMKPEKSTCFPLLPSPMGTPVCAASKLLHHHGAMGSGGTSSCSGSAFAPLTPVSCSSGSPAPSGGNPL